MSEKWQVAVCGCALVDHLFTNLDFNSPVFRKYASKKAGDGGLQAGKLTFAEDLEHFAGRGYDSILCELTDGAEPTASNLGGPAIVAAINVSQILFRDPVNVSYYGVMGNDNNAVFIQSLLRQTELDTTHYRQVSGPTAVTDVLSDPRCNGGKGERTFLNRIGVSGQMTPANLGEDFFAGDVLWFAATALVPEIHDHVDELIHAAHQAGKLTVVSTVFDFRNEKRDPVGPWPLGKQFNADVYRDIDLLIVDKDEALRLSGTGDIRAAADFFIQNGVSAFFITYGAKHFYGYSDGRLFRSTGGKVLDLPVSALVDRDLAEHPERRGDTTGCGDNFAGGAVASLLRQLCEEKERGGLCLMDAAAWAAASGGTACFRIGGTWIEKERGEKYGVLKRYADAYLQECQNPSFL